MWWKAAPSTVADGAPEWQRGGTADVMAYVTEVRRTADVRKNPKAFE